MSLHQVRSRLGLPYSLFRHIQGLNILLGDSVLSVVSLHSHQSMQPAPRTHVLPVGPCPTPEGEQRRLGPYLPSYGANASGTDRFWLEKYYRESNVPGMTGRIGGLHLHAMTRPYGHLGSPNHSWTACLADRTVRGTSCCLGLVVIPPGYYLIPGYPGI